MKGHGKKFLSNSHRWKRHSMLSSTDSRWMGISSLSSLFVLHLQALNHISTYIYEGSPGFVPQVHAHMRNASAIVGQSRAFFWSFTDRIQKEYCAVRRAKGCLFSYHLIWCPATSVVWNDNVWEPSSKKTGWDGWDCNFRRQSDCGMQNGKTKSAQGLPTTWLQPLPDYQSFYQHDV